MMESVCEWILGEMKEMLVQDKWDEAHDRIVFQRLNIYLQELGGVCMVLASQC